MKKILEGIFNVFERFHPAPSTCIIILFSENSLDISFKKFVENQTGFVTRLKDNAVYDTVLDNEIDENIHSL